MNQLSHRAAEGLKRLGILFVDSIRELRHVNAIAVCGLMAALGIVIGSFSIPVGDTIKIGFSGLPNEVVDYLYGPMTGSLFAAAMDVIKYLVHPTGAFFPGFTVSALVAGLIYGIFFYRHKISFVRILTAKFLVAIVVNTGMNTLWLSMLYGKGFLAILPARFLKNLIECPIDALLLFLVLKLLDKSGIFRTIRRSRRDKDENR